jgi:gliding motility associated protien GldN
MMKNRSIKLSLLFAAFSLLALDGFSQANRRPAQQAARPAPAAAAPVTPAPAPVQNQVQQPAPAAKAGGMESDIKVSSNKPSLRNDNSFERNLVRDRVPLEYEHIREDDAAYVQRVWREIDVHEKMNIPFAYKATGDQGNQRFIMILLGAIKREEITAFDATVDDRFTTPISFKQIAEMVVGKPKTISKPDLNQDPDGSKGIMKDTVIQEEFNPDIIERFMIKEDWIFDKESSRMYTRILGIAPMRTVLNSDGSFRAVTPLFWVYYPELRPMLAKYEAYNGRNFGARMSWEELFETRLFSSRIVKSTVNNPNDLAIIDYIKDPLLALLEGENVREKIFSYEQDLWSY